MGSSTHLPFRHGVEVETLRNLSILILSESTSSRLIRKFSLKNIRWKQAIDYGGKLTSSSGLHEYVHIHTSHHTMTHTHFNWHMHTHTHARTHLSHNTRIYIKKLNKNCEDSSAQWIKVFTMQAYWLESLQLVQNPNSTHFTALLM